MTLTRAALEDLLRRIRAVRLGVLGDFGLDAYWSIDEAAGEMSLETGLTTQPVASQYCSLGGASNVAANLAALGCGCVELFGAIGDDPWGRELQRLVAVAGLAAEALLVETGQWATTAYVKPHIDDRETRRYDFGSLNQLPDEAADRVLAALETRLPQLDVVVINQQVHRGLHTPHLRRRLAALIAAHPDKTFIVDSRHFRGEFPGACLKINEREACGESGIEIPLHTAAPDDVVRSAAETLHQRMRRPVFITRAARGMLVCDEHGLFDAPAVPLTGEIDPVGAGDATLAGVAAALAAGAEPRTAADFACLVAAVTVKKLRQCGTASPEEIRALLPSNSAGDETP